MLILFVGVSFGLKSTLFIFISTSLTELENVLNISIASLFIINFNLTKPDFSFLLSGFTFESVPNIAYSMAFLMLLFPDSFDDGD